MRFHRSLRFFLSALRFGLVWPGFADTEHDRLAIPVFQIAIDFFGFADTEYDRLAIP